MTTPTPSGPATEDDFDTHDELIDVLLVGHPGRPGSVYRLRELRLDSEYREDGNRRSEGEPGALFWRWDVFTRWDEDLARKLERHAHLKPLLEMAGAKDGYLWHEATWFGDGHDLHLIDWVASGGTLTAATDALRSALQDRLDDMRANGFRWLGQRYPVPPEAAASLLVALDGADWPTPAAAPALRRVAIRRGLPPVLPQQTFQEAKSLTIAIADGAKLRRWVPIDGELALRHVVKGSPLETKLLGHPLLDWLGLPSTIDNLRAELQQAGLPAVILLHVVLGTALDKLQARRAFVTVAIDELLNSIGWKPRSRQQRDALRRRVWRYLALFDAMQVIGRRDGKYRDPETRGLIDLSSRDALIRITGRRDPAQLAFDDSQPPLEVTYVAGPWIEQWRGDRRILTYFGSIQKLAAIPAGKPSGAWAQSVGLALHQRWRERAAKDSTMIGRVGDDKKITVRGDPFTRRDLLNLFPPEPTVDEILGSTDPGRAKDFWRDLVAALKQAKVIGYYHEPKPLSGKRQGWADEWLDQPLDIRPCPDDAAAVAEIAGNARARKRALSKKRGQGKATDAA